MYLGNILSVITHGTHFSSEDNIRIVCAFRPNAQIPPAVTSPSVWVLSADDVLSKSWGFWLKFVKLKPTDVTPVLDLCLLTAYQLLSDLQYVILIYITALTWLRRARNLPNYKAKNGVDIFSRLLHLSDRIPCVYGCRARKTLECCSFVSSDTLKINRILLPCLQTITTKQLVGWSPPINYREDWMLVSLEPLQSRQLKTNLFFLYCPLCSESFPVAPLQFFQVIACPFLLVHFCFKNCHPFLPLSPRFGTYCYYLSAS